MEKKHYLGLALAMLAGVQMASSKTNGTKVPFETPLKWTASDIVVGPVPDGSHPVVAVKDPSIVRYKGKWHIYATTASTNGAWGMEYISFSDWKDAAKAKPTSSTTTRICRATIARRRCSTSPRRKSGT